jgi:hypothetical protein
MLRSNLEGGAVTQVLVRIVLVGRTTKAWTHVNDDMARTRRKPNMTMSALMMVILFAVMMRVCENNVAMIVYIYIIYVVDGDDDDNYKRKEGRIDSCLPRTN